MRIGDEITSLVLPRNMRHLRQIAVKHSHYSIGDFDTVLTPQWLSRKWNLHHTWWQSGDLIRTTSQAKLE